ncbi:hypothetical protein V6N12_043361 [Hibiscus sabdariffa]|uniref:Uncharacterized protein n=1 Tax=Hibiscus sabdariffa TaxID=183260 RepID=A0ABR2DF48_9ROSI
MYAEMGLLFPYTQNFAQDFELFEEYCQTQKLNASMMFIFSCMMWNDPVQTSATEYNLEGEVDMFRALEPIIEEPIVGLDPMTAAISLMSCGEDVITSEGLKAADIESFPNEQLVEVLYECQKDLMAEAAKEASLAAVLDFETPVVKTDESQNQNNELLGDASFQKSVSSGCISSMGPVQRAAIEPNFLYFPVMDFGSVYTMRAYSEGDIKVSISYLCIVFLYFTSPAIDVGAVSFFVACVTLGNGNVSVIHSPLERPLTVSSCATEDRREKLSRYRNKKMKRNFGRKIKEGSCRQSTEDPRKSEKALSKRISVPLHSIHPIFSSPSPSIFHRFIVPIPIPSLFNSSVCIKRKKTGERKYRRD